MKRKNNRGHKLSKDRALQVMNNVAEEYLDFGDMTFATKEELCETIIWLGRIHQEEYQRIRSSLSNVVTVAVGGLMNKKVDVTSEPT